MRVVVRSLLLAALVALSPAAAFAQAVIAGSIKDASGAVLPGVTVEAASPALIEKVRSAVSDGSGVFRIEDLRPGTYTVTFTLPGFATFKREGIQLTGSFTASVDAEMRIGGLTETVTVTGESPIVDVSSARRETTINNDILKAIPTVRSYNALVVVVPGVVTNLNDTVVGTSTTQFPIHGGRNNEGRMTIDGMNVGNPPGGNQPPAYVADVGNAEEVTFSTSGGLGESETGGLTMNVVPKTGGNRYTGALFFSGTNKSLQSKKASFGLVPTPYDNIYDLNGAIGGPIRQDAIWFFINGRTQGSRRPNTNQFFNLNAGDATKWLYARGEPGFSQRKWENLSGRVTWQANPTNKISAFWDEQATCRRCDGQTSGITDPARVSPEAGSVGATKPLRVMQATWSSPVTNRLLFDAGFGGVYYGWGSFERDPNPTRGLTRVTEQCAAGCADNGGIAGLVYRSQDFNVNNTGSFGWKSNVSYVTGSHSMKVGYQGTWMTDNRTWMTNDTNLSFRVSNGIPNLIQMSLSPYQNDGRAGWYAAFVQEQWTAGRLTLQGALRFDHASSWFPEQTLGPSKYFPNTIVFPTTKGVDSYNDFTPRLGLAYDVFGNGKTAVKANLGKYLEGVGVSTNYANSNPTLRIPTSTGAFGVQGVTRAWTDADADFVPDCDLNILIAQGPTTAVYNGGGADFCGAVSNARWGQNVLTNQYDPDLLKGWGVRPSDWGFGVSVQQQLLRRMSVEVAFHRRSFAGFTVQDNTLVANNEFDAYSVTAPSDPVLPGGGGYVLSGLYDVTPLKFGQILNNVTDSKKLGDASQVFNGVDVTLNMRQGGLTLQGGTSTGQTTSNFCDVRRNLPELAIAIGAGLQTSTVGQGSPYCDVSSGFLTQFRGLASYVIPRVDAQISAVFQSKPGPAILANWAVPSAVVAQSLGRSLAGNAPNATVNLIEPGTVYGNRVNQLDLRMSKNLRVGTKRTMLSVDLYNALNTGAILTYNAAYAPPTATAPGVFKQPLTVATPLMVRFTAEFTF